MEISGSHVALADIATTGTKHDERDWWGRFDGVSGRLRDGFTAMQANDFEKAQQCALAARQLRVNYNANEPTPDLLDRRPSDEHRPRNRQHRSVVVGRRRHEAPGRVNGRPADFTRVS